MKSTLLFALALALAVPIAGCGNGAEDEPEEAQPERTGLVVADTTIDRDLNTRLGIDPRLDDPEIQIRARSVDGEVTLLGVVPSRFELSIAMEVARSTPGVHQVWVDSVRVLSEAPPDEQGEARTTTE